MMTDLSPAKAYIKPERKRRLDRIVEATSRRMTISKLIDELAEMGLPTLEKKYGVFNAPTQSPTAPRAKRRHAA